jgi:pimeloyl-ACP methyl ester carboxylesterase
LERVAPAFAARLGERLFLTPPRHRAPAREQAVLREAAAFDVPFEGGRLRAWRWGQGPTVLLVHGWGGRGGQLTPFVAPLRAAGFAVVAYDAPAHGTSSGRLASVPLFAESLRAVAAHLGTVQGLVAHSMGAAGSAVALVAGLPVEAAVFVGPPRNPAHFFQEFADAFGFSVRQGQAVRERIEQRLGVPFDEFDLPRFAGTLTVPLLVIHDASDAEVPYAHGEAVARSWPGAELVTTTGLGHRRVLRDAGVVARAVAFLANRLAPPRPQDGNRDSGGGSVCANPSCTQPVGESWDEDQRLCASCGLSEELFFRPGRWIGAAGATA